MTIPSEEAMLGLNRAVTTARLQAGAVHEVNNALQVISGTVEILEGRTDLPPMVVQALERLRNQSRRAAQAMAEVLVFTKAVRGSRAPVNMKEVVTHAVALRQFALKRARLAARIDGDASSYLVIGNRGDLEQAFLNLLMNAEQALAGVPGGTVVVELAQEAGHTIVRVIDEGRGMRVPPEQAMSAFVSDGEPFDSAGLGLWATKVLVEQHGGTLSIQPRPKGTAAVMRLPAS